MNTASVSTGQISQRVFLVGCPRSGTTLLQSMLVSHSQIESFPETHLFERGFAGRYGGRRHIVPSFILRGYYLGAIRSAWVSELKRLDYKVYSTAILDYSWSKAKAVDSFIQLLDSLTLSNSKSIWVEKTPGHVHRIDSISKYVSEPKFIHLIRDGRAVVASLYEVAKRYPKLWSGPYSIKECITRWNACLADTSKRIGMPNHFVVSYERLLDNPESCLAKLCGFLDVEYEPSMLSDYASVAGKIVTQDERWKAHSSEPLKDTRLSKYHELFNKMERLTIESLLNWPAFREVSEAAE